MLNSKGLWASAIIVLAILVQPVFSQTTVTPRGERVFQDGVVKDQPFDKVFVDIGSDGVVKFTLLAGNNRFSPFDSSRGEKSPSPTFDKFKYTDVDVEQMGNENFLTLDENVSSDEKTINISFTIKDAKFFGVGKSLHFEGNMVVLGNGKEGGEKKDHHWAIEISLNEIDLDIDSTDNFEDYFTTNFRTPEIDADEDIAAGGKWKGKTIFVNDIDKDGDHVPDYADGWDCSYLQIGLLPGEKMLSNHRKVNLKEKFVPLILELKPQSLAKADQIRVKFEYPLSRLEDMKMMTKKWEVKMGRMYKNPDPQLPPIAKEDPNQVEAILVKADKSGKIRIWTKDGNLKRSKDDIVEPNKVYTLKEFKMEINKPFTFYIEGINASENWRDIRIVASLSLDGGKTWKAEDAVRCTCIRSNFTVGVVRQYTFNKVGMRELFEPDYSKPEATLSKYYEATKNAYMHLITTNGSLLIYDPWWHEGDATLGHGFCFYQYEGPTSTDYPGLSSGDADYQKYDNTRYFGKTGNSGHTFWEYGRSYANSQAELTWWHYCTYEINNKPLVVKKAYTVNPKLLSDMVLLLNTNQRYDSPRAYNPSSGEVEDVLTHTAFGLDISYSEKPSDEYIPGTSIVTTYNPRYKYGCLSNVGLVLSFKSQADYQPPFNYINIQMPGFGNYKDEKECKWVFAKHMPTSANKSVWDVIMCLVGYVNSGNDQKAILQNFKLLNEAADVVIKHNAGVKWGETTNSNSTTDPKSLRCELFNLLKGRKIPGINNGNTITQVDEIKLNLDTDWLNYFDPGLVPGDLSSNPGDTFYTRKE